MTPLNSVHIHDVPFTNLRCLQFGTTFGDLKIVALWGPAVMGQGTRQTIAAITVNEALHLVHTSYTPVPSLLQVADQILTAAC
ncbi:MAG: hypothetical protein M3Y56_04695 [Armatimonadota bacterium]|nr:hypothetical protein [Armatimonadota bacterium]